MGADGSLSISDLNTGSINFSYQISNVLTSVNELRSHAKGLDKCGVGKHIGVFGDCCDIIKIMAADTSKSLNRAILLVVDPKTSSNYFIKKWSF